MRCDVAIVDGNEIRCLFEVKDTGPPRAMNHAARQRRALGAASEIVPVFFVYGMERVDAAVRAAVDWCNSGRRLTA
jgi:hypothetical protein